MGSFANSLFKILLGWLQGIVSAVWTAFTNENGNLLFTLIGRNWILIAAILCLIGLVSDLFIYILRWKPFKVWRSFFAGNKAFSEKQSHNKEISAGFDMSKDEPADASMNHESDSIIQTKHDDRQIPDLSKWENGDTEKKHTPSEETPVMVTNAGYVVPADSPYRRPADDLRDSNTDRNDTENRMNYTIGAQNAESGQNTPKRRRRISVSELFADPEEELRQFDPPQQIIDSRKAYRDPVYPRGWKKSEDNEE